MNHEIDNSMPDENLMIARATAQRVVELEKVKGRIEADVMGHEPDSEEMLGQYVRAQTDLFMD